MNLLHKNTIYEHYETSCKCIENNVYNALNKWNKNKNDFFHDEITELFIKSNNRNIKYELNNNLSLKTLNEIKVILFVLDLQIENNIFFPCFLMKYYGINYDQSCVIINCLHMMDLCIHTISLIYPFISTKGKQILDLDNTDYHVINNWLNNNICTFNEFTRIEDNHINDEIKFFYNKY